MRKIRFWFALALLLALIVGPVFAQEETTEEPPVTVTPVPEPEEPPVLEPGDIPSWEDFLVNAAAVFATLGVLFGPLSELLVSGIKWLLAKVWPDGLKYTGPIAFFLPLAIAILYWSADSFGLGAVFLKAGNFLLLITPVILGFFGIQVVQHATYQTMKKLNAPVTGTTSAQYTAE